MGVGGGTLLWGIEFCRYVMEPEESGGAGSGSLCISLFMTSSSFIYHFIELLKSSLMPDGIGKVFLVLLFELC